MAKIFVAFFLVVLATFSSACQRPGQQVTAVAPSPSPSPSSAPAQSLPPAANPPVEIGKPYPGTGVVKFINKKEGWIEINHEEIVGLMPPMEMEWSVQKRSMLDKVKVGDKVNFVVVETGKGEILTELKKAQ